MKDHPALTDPKAAQTLSDTEWVAFHVKRFAQKKVTEAYHDYETLLTTVLKVIAKRVAPLAVVEVRSKGLASFAEKILRKRGLYQDPVDPLPPDPLLRITDLCGGRIICQTATQVKAVCRLIEQAFTIDWANSEDASQRLKTTEFGYRSVHYIVQCDPKRLAEAKIEGSVPQNLMGFPVEILGKHAAGIPLKAEIQVRTLLEHASSSFGHDTIYKTDLKVPSYIKRDYAAVAAVLEAADQDAERILTTFHAFKSNSGAWNVRSELQKEIDQAQVLLRLPAASLPVPEKIPIAVRAAQLAIAIGRQETAVGMLTPFKTQAHAGIQRVLGQALVELNWDSPNSVEFGVGRKHLMKASQLSPDNAETLGLLAECAAHSEDPVQAREWFARAVAADGAEPITLVHYLEFETAKLANDSLLLLANPMIRAALNRAQKQIESRANLALAWSAVATAQLFLREPYAALYGLAQLVRLCDFPAPVDGTPGSERGPCTAGRALLRLWDTLRRLRDLRDRLPGFAWFERFLLLALATRMREPWAIEEITRLASWQTTPTALTKPHLDPKRRVVVLAGGCEPELQHAIKTFSSDLFRACQNVGFDLISGGTRSGISEVAGSLASASAGRIRAYGYLPGHTPRGVKEDTERFNQCFSSPGTDFSPLEPLQAWTDIVGAGIQPSKVRLLCYAPGDIARAECAVALALGARVGVVVDRSLPKDRLFDSTPWEGCPNLLMLPGDAMTLRAFLQIDLVPISDAERRRLERAAQMAHEDYVRSATPKEPSLQQWDQLSESLQLSNYHQVAYWEKVLGEYGLGVRKLTEEDKRHAPLVIRHVLDKSDDKDPIVALAEIEHGRWNVERLSYGWCYAPEKDVTKKLSPWLIPWKDLPKAIQNLDLDAVVHLPEKLREAGLEIYEL